VLTVKGYEDSGWPAVAFTFTATDTFLVSARRVVVPASAPRIDLDLAAQWIGLAVAVFLAGLTGGLSLVFGALFGFEIIYASTHADPSQVPALSLGQAIARNIFPATFFTHPEVKMDMIYRNCLVEANGIRVDGYQSLMPRYPGVSVLGPRDLSEDFDADHVTAQYRAVVTDVKMPYTVVWNVDTGASITPDKQVVVSDDQIAFTAIRFAIPAGSSPGDVIARKINVRVIGDDGVSPAAASTVRIHLSSAVEDVTDESELFCIKHPDKCASDYDDNYAPIN